MRLLQVSLRSSLIYSLIVVLISIPVSIFSIRGLLKHEVDEALALRTEQFLFHIKRYNYLDDLESDLEVFDQLSYDIDIKPYDGQRIKKKFHSVHVYDSLEHDFANFRELLSEVEIKGKPYILSVRMSMVDNDELIVAVGIVQSALIILLATGLLLLNRSLSRKLWQPFYKTLNQLKAYQLDKNESIQTDKTNIVEFDDMNKTISDLIGSNRKVYTDQKEFIENASHELQTPLAIFQSKLDLLMQKSSMSESEAMTIMELEATAQRMSKLNKNLLLLSKIDNKQFADREEIDLSRLIHDLLSDLKPMADVAGISINSAVSPLMLSANKTLIEVLLTNLFHNAIRHTTASGRVFIELENKTLRVVNTGEPIKMSVEKMFQRFSKEGTNSNSTGLGLAIVKKICDTSSYELKYLYEKGSHIFAVSF
jgi:signal transduction histidine kinase